MCCVFDVLYDMQVSSLSSFLLYVLCVQRILYGLCELCMVTVLCVLCVVFFLCVDCVVCLV